LFTPGFKIHLAIQSQVDRVKYRC